MKAIAIGTRLLLPGVSKQEKRGQCPPAVSTNAMLMRVGQTDIHAYIHTYIHTYIYIERETDIQTDRQTDRQTCIQINSM